ncbi:MAG: DUF3313 domain-containing protein, partial [Candidatus Phytoplasma australasiaticum]|nr:DUF3313 domain-containing protein [Candidatus Phytoplasma australasiaticum]
YETKFSEDFINSYIADHFKNIGKKTSGPGPGVLVVRPAITAASAKTKGLRPYEVIPIALVAAGISAATGIRDQDTTLATEAAFLDGRNNTVVAQVVRMGAGADLDNSAQVLKANDFKAVLDVWAKDMVTSYQQLKTK